MSDNNSLLGYALLGLIHQQPQSGYDLRKAFTTTAMGSFSDSPGAIYPALARLEARGMARGAIEPSNHLRKRRVFKITPKGLATFKAWLKAPVTRGDVIRRADGVLLRFAFIDQGLGPGHSTRFLRQFAGQLEDYLVDLQQFLNLNGRQMPLSARLAFECGIRQYASRLEWARSSIEICEKGKGNRK